MCQAAQTSGFFFKFRISVTTIGNTIEFHYLSLAEGMNCFEANDLWWHKTTLELAHFCFASNTQDVTLMYSLNHP